MSKKIQIQNEDKLVERKHQGIIVGEARGKEAVDILKCLKIGNTN